MFSFIRFGERAGSGLNGIVYVWKKVYHTDPEIFVKEEYDRTFLKLPTLGNEPDVEAMAEFYPDEEETSDKRAINSTLNENGTLNDTLKSQIIEMIRVNPNVNAFQLIKLLNKSLRQIRRLLAKLQAEGTIRRVGADKNGHWEIINNQPNN
jgi:predicted HTH transcriptional regulator